MAGTPTGRSPARLALLLALALVATGAALRVAGVDSGLPFIYDPDEPDFVDRAFRMLATGNLDPGWFGHPGTLTMYAFLAAFAGHARALGGSMAELQAAYRQDPSAWFLLARCVMVAFAAGTLALTWRIARRVAGPWAGLLAVALLAVAPLHTMLSRIARPDMEMTFFVLASTLAALGVLDRGRWRDYLAAGFLLGLGTATKYPAVVFAVTIALAHAWGEAGRGGRPWRRLERLAGAGAATVAGLFAGSPWLFFSPGVALRDVTREARNYHLGATSGGFLPSLGEYLGGPVLAEVGLLGAALVLAGAWAAWRRPDRAARLVLAAPALFLVFISLLTLHWDRWVLPAVPFACVLAALGLREVGEALRTLLPGGRGAVAAAVAVGLAAVAPVALDSIGWTVAAARGDTRDFAWRWIVANVPAGSRVLVESYAPQLEPERYALYAAEGEVWRLDAEGRRYAVPRGVIGTLGDADAVVRARIDYFVITNHYDRRLAEPQRYARQIGVYEELMRRHERVFEAEPGQWRAVGLPVRVYRVRD